MFIQGTIIGSDINTRDLYLDTLTTFSVSLHNETEPIDEGIRCQGMEMTTERMTGSRTRVHYLQYGLCGNNRCFKCQWSDARVHLMHLTSNH